MTRQQKEQISDKLGDLIVRFLNKRCDDMPYSDIVRMFLNHTCGVVRMCVRESMDGCKRNSRKTDRRTRDIFRWFANAPRKEQLGFYGFEDDKDED